MRDNNILSRHIKPAPKNLGLEFVNWPTHQPRHVAQNGRRRHQRRTSFRLRVMMPGSSIAPRGHILSTPRLEHPSSREPYDVFQGYCDLVFLDGCSSINLNRVTANARLLNDRKCSSITRTN